MMNKYYYYFIIKLIHLLLFFHIIYSQIIQVDDIDDDGKPQQIHISLGSNINEIFITWTTYSSCDFTLINFGVNKNDLNQTNVGYCNEFIDDDHEIKRIHYIHRVRLKNLKFSTRYYYQCYGSNSLQTIPSSLYSFKTIKSYNINNNDDNDWNVRLIIFGDLGLENEQSIERIKNEINDDNVDLIIHVGDIAYDLDTNNSYVGDEFMRKIEPIAARIPYQTCPGNHEQNNNFSNYMNRFTMYDMIDNEINNHYYTFNIGPIKFISFSTEFYFFVQYGFIQIFRQYEWLKRVLIDANENRHHYPWIITYGHRPMYCSNDNYDDCTRFESIIRRGLPLIGLGLEKLFYDYGVDLEIWAHQHSYERLWPIYDTIILNGSIDQNNPYHNANAPIHITTGSAGCKENLSKFRKQSPIWSAKRIVDYGYTKLLIVNKTHLHVQQISDDMQGKIVDSFTIIKDHPLPMWLRK